MLTSDASFKQPNSYVDQVNQSDAFMFEYIIPRTSDLSEAAIIIVALLRAECQFS